MKRCKAEDGSSINPALQAVEAELAAKEAEHATLAAIPNLMLKSFQQHERMLDLEVMLRGLKQKRQALLERGASK